MGYAWGWAERSDEVSVKLGAETLLEFCSCSD